MNSTTLRLECALEGTKNFVASKILMDTILGYNGLQDYIKKYVVNPPTVNAKDFTQWKKDVAKVRGIILEGV